MWNKSEDYFLCDKRPDITIQFGLSGAEKAHEHDSSKSKVCFPQTCLYVNNLGAYLSALVTQNFTESVIVDKLWSQKANFRLIIFKSISVQFPETKFPLKDNASWKPKQGEVCPPESLQTRPRCRSEQQLNKWGKKALLSPFTLSHSIRKSHSFTFLFLFSWTSGMPCLSPGVSVVPQSDWTGPERFSAGVVVWFWPRQVHKDTSSFASGRANTCIHFKAHVWYISQTCERSDRLCTQRWCRLKKGGKKKRISSFTSCTSKVPSKGSQVFDPLLQMLSPFSHTGTRVFTNIAHLRLLQQNYWRSLSPGWKFKKGTASDIETSTFFLCSFSAWLPQTLSGLFITYSAGYWQSCLYRRTWRSKGAFTFF